MKELQEYTNAVIGIKQFKEQHSDVFSQLEVMEETKNALEEKLKVVIKESKQDINNGVVDVKFVQSWRKWYDFSAFSKKAQKVIKDGGALILKEPEVDKDKLEELAKQGLVDRQELRNAYQEKPLSPSVRIKTL